MYFSMNDGLEHCRKKLPVYFYCGVRVFSINRCMFVFIKLRISKLNGALHTVEGARP